MKIVNAITVILFVLLMQSNASAHRECDNLKGMIIKAVKKAEVSGGCKAIAMAFEATCTAGTAGEGAPECAPGAAHLYAGCKFFGKKYVHNEAKDIANDVCDYVYPDLAPYIVIENSLKSHEVDFQAVISKGGDNVHMRGNNWLTPKTTGILASYKLDGENFKGEVKARVKRDCDESLLPSHPEKYKESCNDRHLHIKDVKPGKHLVQASHHDGKYYLSKKNIENDFKPFIPVENRLGKHKVEFSVDIPDSPNVHLPGEDWLRPGEKATLFSYKLYRDSYTVKIRVKKGAHADVEKTVSNVRPGQDKVYVDYRDGKYIVGTEPVTSKFYFDRTIPVVNNLKNHKVDFRVVIDHGPDAHLPGDNWLKPGKVRMITDHRFYKDSYTVKARIKTDGIDEHLTISDVKPGQHSISVYYKNGKYHIHKEKR